MSGRWTDDVDLAHAADESSSANIVLVADQTTPDGVIYGKKIRNDMKSTRRYPIDMTLRLWSEDVPLRRVVESLDLSAQYLHMKGCPIEKDGRPSGRIAVRHFASVAQAEGRSPHDISDWLRKISTVVASDDELVDLLRSERIEALFWIAFFGPTPVLTPTLDVSLVQAVANLGGRILLENYTDLSLDCPSKIWLPNVPDSRLDEKSA